MTRTCVIFSHSKLIVKFSNEALNVCSHILGRHHPAGRRANCVFDNSESFVSEIPSANKYTFLEPTILQSILTSDSGVE